MIKRISSFLVFSLLIALSCVAEQVTWSYKILGDNTPTPSIQITAAVEPGFHLYAPNTPDGGGQPLEFHFDVKGCTLDGTPKANKAYTKEYNDVFEVDEYFYTGTVTFTQKLKAAADKWEVKAEVKGQVCDEQGCFRVLGSHAFKGTAPVTDAVKKEAEALKEAEKEKKDSVVEAVTAMTDSLQGSEAFMTPAANMSGVNAGKWWANVEAEINVFKEDPVQQSRSLWYIFIAGFIGGLIALVTPCVWPMIPMTVSFFLKGNKTRRKAITSAMVYGGGIVVIYVLLGLVVTAIF